MKLLNFSLSHTVKNRSFLTIVSLLFVFAISAQTFTHPGMLHKESDLQRMKTKVSNGEQPWKAGYDKLVGNWHSPSDYRMRGPLAIVYRGYDGTHPENYTALFHDAAAAYMNALRWKISGSTLHADKAIEIMNAWASTLTAIRGTTDGALAAGLQGYQFANAAEIMRSYSGWKPADFEKFKTMLINVFYAINKDFLIRHNGTCDTHYWANWDLAQMASMISIGILCDNRNIYNEAVKYYKFGIGNGNINRLVNYLYDGGLGQYQESGRDQGHSTMAPGIAGAFCEMAWNQGDDLYGYGDNRLLKGFEYIAKYNLGNAVPYTAYNNCDNVNQVIIADGARNIDRPVWEMIYNHYVVRKGLYSPYVQIYAQKVRPESGGEGTTSGSYDQLGLGTLTATLETYSKKPQTISFPVITPMVVGEQDRELNAKATSGNGCYYTSSNPAIAEIVNNRIHAWKCGTAVITAWQIGDDTYGSAAPVTQTVTVTAPVTKLDGNVIFYLASNWKTPSVAVDEGANVIQWGYLGHDTQKWTLTSVDSVYFKIVSLKSGKALGIVANSDTVARVEIRTYNGNDYQLWRAIDNCDGATIRLVNKGNGLTLGIEAGGTKDGDFFEVNTYKGEAYQHFRFAQLSTPKIAQKITFGKLPALYPGEADYTLTAKASSNLPITYTSTNPEVATVSNGVIHVLKGGATTIIASQAGNGTYKPAFDVAQLLLTKKSQNFIVPELPVVRYKDPNFRIGVSSSSDIPYTLSSSSTLVATVVTEDSLKVGMPGITTLTFYQQGDSAFLPTFIQKDLTVEKANQTINFPTLPELKIGDADYAPGATASSSLYVKYSSSNVNVATIVSNKIHVVGAGTTLITASQAGNPVFNATPDSVQSLVVNTASGIDGLSADQILIYPNPTTREFTVTLPSGISQDYAIRVYSLLGNLIYENAYCVNKTTVDLGHNPAGVYILTIQSGEKSLMTKIIKK